VNLAGLAVLAGLLGMVIGFVVAWSLLRRRAPADPDMATVPDAPTVPDGLSDVLNALRAAGAVIGPHDEVLQSTPLAQTLGVVRGSRVAVAPILELVRQVRREQRGQISDLELPRPGTANAYFHVRVVPLPDQQVLLLAEDETAARRIEQTRRDFVANVSHELKTPIGALSLLAEAVEEAADDPPAVRRFSARMGIESARLTDLISQIIDLSRLQADNPLTTPELVEIDDVLTDAVDRCRVDAERHGVALTIAGAQGCHVVGNLRQLSIAVGNLVENAVVYSDPDTRVVVAAHRQVRSDDDYVEITVSDNGIGIPEREQARIFERFYRVDYARSRANGGTGLGLAIVKHIAASHNGEVSVWSQPGHGSTFTISLPAHQPVASLPVDGELNSGLETQPDSATQSSTQNPTESGPVREEPVRLQPRNSTAGVEK
jgi:two-component system sensor histidine kinase SenX3